MSEVVNTPKLRFPKFTDAWIEKKIEECFTFKNGLNKEKEYFGKGTPIINFTDVYHLSQIKKNDIEGLVELNKKETENYSAKKGDVFFTRTSETIIDIGMSATLVEEIKDCVFSGFVLRARPTNNELDNLFKSYCFNTQSVRKEIVTKSSFTTRALTSGTLLNKVAFKYPQDIEEQKKIASFVSLVDKKITLLKQKKDHLGYYKKGIMQKIFNQELCFKDDDGNSYPDWEEKRLEEVAEIITGSTPSTFKPEYYNGNINFVSPADIQQNRYVVNTKTKLTELGFSKSRKIKKGSVVFVCIGSTIGKVAQLLNDSATNQQINSLVPFPKFNSNFLYSLLEYYGPKIKLLAGIQAVPQINKSDFSKIKLKMPSLEEQVKIANFLSSIDAKIELVTNELKNTEIFKKGLLQQMFV